MFVFPIMVIDNPYTHGLDHGTYHVPWLQCALAAGFRAFPSSDMDHLGLPSKHERPYLLRWQGVLNRREVLFELLAQVANRLSGRFGGKMVVNFVLRRQS